MEGGLQHSTTSFEPQRAHTNRVRSTPHAGAKLEQTLLMNEGKLGSRSTELECSVRLTRLCFAAHFYNRSAFNLLMRSSTDPRSEEHTSELQSQFHLVCR